MSYFLLMLLDLASASALRAFIIPAGSMAPTLICEHQKVTCPHCGASFPVNASSAASGQREPVGCMCFNCRLEIHFKKGAMAPPMQGRDRFLTRLLISKPERGAVVAYKYPRAWYQETPELRYYVSRVIGLPGDTIALHYGRAYYCRDLKYPDDRIAPEERWQEKFMHRVEAKAVKLYQQGKFRIIRKPPELMLALRRPVHDNDFVPKKAPPHWVGVRGSGWTRTPDHGFRHEGSKDVDWLRYRHLVPAADARPQAQLITDFDSFNSYVLENRPGLEITPNWVGDLMLECQVTLAKAEGEFWLELVKGADHFQARCQLDTGQCTIYRRGADGKLRELASRPTPLNQAGSFRLRFANFDERLTLWVNDHLPFSDGIEYASPATRGPAADDLQPVAIGSKGAAVRVQHLQLWRDIYYSYSPVEGADFGFERPDLTKPADWGRLRNIPVRTFYVQPGHYFLLSDNSPAANDSRVSGVVPDTLLMYRAMLRYFPLQRMGWVR